MPKASELKRGIVVLLDGAPHIVEDLAVQQPSARGGASLYKVRYRNLVSKQKADRTHKGDDALEPADFERRDVQFSYAAQGQYIFMDLEDFSEIAMEEDALEYERQFLTEGLEGIRALLSEGRLLAIELPDVVELKVTTCDPSIRGASATARTKPATVSTGYTCQVPEYLAPGEVIRIDTRTGKFLQRA